MSALPTGTVTFLFTDIEGSTRRWDRFPDAMPYALERHDAILRRAIEGRSGHVFKTVGDAFYAAFASAGAGILAATEAQRALSDQDWSAFAPGFSSLRVRMGLHTGEAMERDGDYFGQTLNRVARITSAGHGGQVLLSNVTASLVRAHLPPGLTLRDWGEHRLRDLRRTEHLYQLVDPTLPKVDEPPRSAGILHPRDRVHVEAAGPQGSLPEGDPWSRLELALRSETESIRLTPAEAIAMARRRPSDWREWRLGRVAEWSQPRFRLDGRFVDLTLLVDTGEEAVQGRWQAREDRFTSLEALLTAVADPAIVVLGPPGSGKSTLLRHLELDLAIEGLRSESAREDARRVSFFVALSSHAPSQAGPAAPPGDWLAARWRTRYPAQPRLEQLLAEGRMTLLLDGLNELPAASPRELRARVRSWKAWLQQLVATWPGNRVIFSCRSLDYSQPLSTPELRVPQARIEALTDAQVRDFMAVYSPGHWREVWQALNGRPQLALLRSPYFLALLLEQVEAAGKLPAGRAELFTGFVRQALRREILRGSPLFEPGALLTHRDLRRVVGWKWHSRYDLPERGILIPKLAGLAKAMQGANEADGRARLRIDLDLALDLLDSKNDAQIVAAGEALAVLDEDEATDELMYVHQLVQEYFAARELAREPEPDLVRSEWRAARMRPPLDALIDALDPADPLPGPPQSGWEEPTLLATAMADDPVRYLKGVAGANLALAGRAAAQPDLKPRLPDDLLDRLRRSLVQRSRDPAADLRARIACGDAVGDLGDPRFQRRLGPHGAYLLPPLVDIQAGTYPIGDNRPIAHAGGTTRAHQPSHRVEIAAFSIGRFPVTNAEWRCFLEAGGYEDDRWWDTQAGRDWRRGVGTAAGIHAGLRHWLARVRAEPELLERFAAQGTFDEAMRERWRRRLALGEAELAADLRAQYPERRFAEPALWHDDRFNRPTRPVVGICWHEARAYLRWLAEQSGRPFRLPTEVEWEAAARGLTGRAYAHGETFDAHRGNTAEAHVRQSTPVGVFPEGDTPEGTADLCGNVFEWTSSGYGQGFGTLDYPYPYDPADGREQAEASPDLCRVARGGSWFDDRSNARAVFRDALHPAVRNFAGGMRVVMG